MWSDKYSARRNPFIEGLANYRDWMQSSFRFTSRNTFGILAVVVVFPALVVAGGLATDKKRDEVMERDFPHIQRKTLNDLRREQQLKKEQQRKENGADDSE